MNKPETIADIIANMRYKTGAICPWQVNGGTCELCPLGHSSHGKDLGKYCSFHKLAHELEAAHKRECGDCAKFREAVVEIIDYLEPIHKWTMPSKENHTKLTALFAAVDTVYMKAKNALAAPPRNCDVYATAEEARQARLNDAENWDEFGSPKLKLDEWLLAPATKKEGGNDADK